MIGVMYAALSVGGTHPLAIEMLISLVMYGETSFAQSFISQVGHGSRSDCFDGENLVSVSAGGISIASLGPHKSHDVIFDIFVSFDRYVGEIDKRMSLPHPWSPSRAFYDVVLYGEYGYIWHCWRKIEPVQFVAVIAQRELSAQR